MKKKLFKLLKIGIISFLLLLIIVVTTLYFSLNEKIPEGKPGSEADNFALKIQEAVHHKEYLDTQYLQWTFRKKNHYTWNKKLNTVEAEIGEDKVFLDLNYPEKNKVLDPGNLSDNENKKVISNALANFNNDSFWVVAPHKLFDNGTTRKLVDFENGSKGLLVTYISGGTTPGDTYLWKVDTNYRPISYQMWVSILPIGGIEATWENWTSTESGAYLSQQHKLLGFGIPISNLRAWNE
ncbi:hypothetical protein [Aquimarina sp. 2201CG5-10]|uniref:hypothetical protein n=1 Tax=Aquimarina callyspongiae TaxID=3098150 RepID=UPI002AB49CC2|nr:hypothetical protein [Aquimarina sp. 2201CG5-10]MDY8135688.1 hypothetical protein [Aquimarina sp. 2201CG5-10]